MISTGFYYRYSYNFLKNASYVGLSKSLAKIPSRNTNHRLPINLLSRKMLCTADNFSTSSILNHYFHSLVQNRFHGTNSFTKTPEDSSTTTRFESKVSVESDQITPISSSLELEPQPVPVSVSNLSSEIKKLEIEILNSHKEAKATSINFPSATGDMHAYWLKQEELILLLRNKIAAEITNGNFILQENILLQLLVIFILL